MLQLIDNKYARIYWALISKRIVEPAEGYTERHHIHPRCIGGHDTTDNLVRLTGREHYVAHLCLVKCTTGKPHFQMVCASKQLAGRLKIKNSRMYEHVRLHHSKMMSSRLQGIVRSESTRHKLSAVHTGRVQPREVVEKRAMAIRGRPRPLSVRQKIAASHRGMKISESARDKLRRADRSKTTGELNGMSKTARIQSPSGEIFTVCGVSAFCKQRNINYDHLRKVLVSGRTTKDGWSGVYI